MLRGLVDAILVGRTPLGSAMRAGLMGCVFTGLGVALFSGLGTWFGFVFGLAVTLIVTPLLYLFSHRDDGWVNWHRNEAEDRGTSVPPMPRRGS